MVETSAPADVAELPPPPRNPLPYRHQLKTIEAFHTGQEVLRDAGGPVTRLKFAPTWLLPEVVIATSPQAARDILSHTGNSAERAPAHDETRYLLGCEPFHDETRSLGAPSARAAAGLHQTKRSRLRRAYGSGRRHGRRELARRPTSRPRRRVPPTHAASTRPLGTRDRSRRARRRDRRILEDSPRLCHSAGDSCRQTTPLAAHSRPPGEHAPRPPPCAG